MSLVYHGFTNITAVFQATWNETVLEKWFELLKIVKSKHYCACMTAAWVAVSILEILSSWLQSLTLKLNCLKNVPLYLNVIFLIRFEMFCFFCFFLQNYSAGREFNCFRCKLYFPSFFSFCTTPDILK